MSKKWSQKGVIVMTTIECINLIKEVFLTGTAITGVLVAIQGLNTWKMQLKGQSDYNLSRTLLIKIYKYRDALYIVRYPIMTGSELALTPEEEKQNLDYTERSYRGSVRAYQKRWDRVLECRNELLVGIVEAEAVWGLELPSLIKDIMQEEGELYLQIKYFLALKNPSLDKSDKEFEREHFNKKFLYDNLDESKDVFRKSFTKLLLPAETYLKRKLHR